MSVFLSPKPQGYITPPLSFFLLFLWNKQSPFPITTNCPSCSRGLTQLIFEGSGKPSERASADIFCSRFIFVKFSLRMQQFSTTMFLVFACLCLFTIFGDASIIGTPNAKGPLNQVASSVDCSKVPPAFWCVSDKLTKECGFDQLCDRYSKATKNKKLQLTLFYEALCPDCQEFIINSFYRDVYLQFGDFMNFELVPYGNAKNQVCIFILFFFVIFYHEVDYSGIHSYLTTNFFSYLFFVLVCLNLSGR